MAKDFLTEQEFNALKGLWYKEVRNDGTWNTLSAFIDFAEKHGFSQSRNLMKRDASKPHGPENSYFYQEETCAFCKGCKECIFPDKGCQGWQEWWTENWNRNIFRGKKPVKKVRELFRYEAPDLERELRMKHEEKN